MASSLHHLTVYFFDVTAIMTCSETVAAEAAAMVSNLVHKDYDETDGVAASSNISYPERYRLMRLLESECTYDSIRPLTTAEIPVARLHGAVPINQEASSMGFILPGRKNRRVHAVCALTGNERYNCVHILPHSPCHIPYMSILFIIGSISGPIFDITTERQPYNSTKGRHRLENIIPMCVSMYEHEEIDAAVKASDNILLPTMDNAVRIVFLQMKWLFEKEKSREQFGMVSFFDMISDDDWRNPSVQVKRRYWECLADETGRDRYYASGTDRRGFQHYMKVYWYQMVSCNLSQRRIDQRKTDGDKRYEVILRHADSEGMKI
jgi:hypothetical protein